jgi:NTP pyrophosphatase (non-canonical NTP hydrolase)
MKLNNYQKDALSTCTERAYNINYLALGLNGEAGEVAEKVKKIIRDNEGIINNDKKVEIVKELGDVLWYVAVLADYLGESLDVVAQANLNKLFSRKLRGKIKGSGDNR